jgi:hypothetical protein
VSLEVVNISFAKFTDHNFRNLNKVATMIKKITVFGAVAALALAVNVQESQAFAPVAFTRRATFVPRLAEETKPAEESAFVASDDEADVDLDTVELLGKGAAKVSNNYCWNSAFLVVAEVLQKF